MTERVILVSNRLPVVVGPGGARDLVPSSGGLVAGLAPVHRSYSTIWIGALDTDGLEEPPDLTRDRLLPVSSPPEEANRSYEGYSNRVLWPLFHYFTESVELDNEDFRAYRAVNERFADVIAATARPGDRIWIHDYHLMLLPALVRARVPGARIGFFLHIPFPASEVFGILPNAEELLRGILGADLIGVHTYDYARHLITSFRRQLGIDFEDGRAMVQHGECRVGVFPLGADAERLERLATAPEVEERLVEWRRQTNGRRVILGVDRLDYTKGLRRRLESFRLLLERRPDLRSSTVLIQVAVPSRGSIGSYQRLKHEVERRVGEINGAFTEGSRVPVLYAHRSIPQEELSALYRLADVALVTPLRDGMNLVAKEYAASRIDDSGVLVLSRFAGAASEMGEALLVNPFDIEAVASTLERALEMDPEESRARMKALRARVKRASADRWASRFLEVLQRKPRHSVDGDLWQTALAFKFAEGGRALLALDYDGTLADIEVRPELAEPKPELLDLLRELAATRAVSVILVSGRDRATMERWFPDKRIHLAAEHGLYVRWAGTSEWETILPTAHRPWMGAVRDVLVDYVARTPGSFIEEKEAAIAWHYRQVEPELGMWQARELANHLAEAFANSPLHVLHGSRVLEVREQNARKGNALSLAMKRLGPFDLVVTAGDDQTDEDLFGASPPGAWSIKIGAGPTRATYRLESPATFRSLLAELLARRPLRASLMPASHEGPSIGGATESRR